MQQHVEQHLHVDLVIGHVDAGRIVDGVGVDHAALHPVLDPPGLRQAEVPAFADDARANARRVDANAIVGPIADLGVVLARGLDVRADAAVVEQVDVHREDVANDLLAARRLRLQMRGASAPPALSGISLAERSNMPPPALIVAVS